MIRWASSVVYASIVSGLALVCAGGCGGEFRAADDSSPEEDSAVPDAGPVADAAMGADAPVESSDAAPCPSGEALCAPCNGPSVCAVACPAVACVPDAGNRPDATFNDASPPPDATVNDAGGPSPDAAVTDAGICPAGEHLCSGCGSPFCGQVCPAIACRIDAAVPIDCLPACTQGTKCCPGGAVGTRTCAKPLSGDVCPALP